MALIDLHKYGASRDREPALRDPDQILAYLEQLHRMRSFLELKVQQEADVSYACQVEEVSESKGTLTLSLQNRPAQEPREGAVIHLWFSITGLRFRAEVRFLRRGGYMQSEFRLPECIRYAERRGPRRARFTVRENAQVVALQSLDDGIGVSGRLVNLSLGGLCFRVAKVMDLRSDRRVSLRSDLLPPGTNLALVRLQDLPQTPTIEAGAIVRHCDLRPGGLQLGLSFEAIGGFELQAIERLLSRKLPGFPTGFPRKPRLAEVVAGSDGLEPEEQEADEAELQEPTECEAALSDGELEDLRNAIRMPDRLQILKRRSRQILLVMGDDLERSALLGHLHAEGYRCLHEARGLVQALERAKRHGLDLLILSQQVGPHSALEVLEQLRAAGRLEQAKAVVLKDREDVRLALAARSGSLALVVPRPLDVEGVLKPGIAGLLGL